MKINTFTKQVKSEICELKYNNSVNEYLLKSFLMNRQNILINEEPLNSIVISLTSLDIITNYIFKILQNKYKKLDVKQISNNKNNKSTFVFNIEKKEYHNPNIDLTKMSLDQKKGFLIGSFLNSGSICFSSEKSSYHFEIRSISFEYLDITKKILEFYNIKSSIINYRNIYKLYFKKSEYLSDILKIMDAENSMYQFEDNRIQKDFTNSLQRLTNLEISNINKTVIASKNHIKWIKFLKNRNILSTFDEKLQLFCKIRIKNPDCSLSMISEIMKEKYNINIPRTSLNHFIQKIKNKYDELN